MEGVLMWIAGVVVVAGLVACVALFFHRRIPATQGPEHHAGRLAFQARREWLEARFFTLASRSGKPRGLAWVDCEFDREVAWARDRVSRELRALVAVTIRFEAIQGGGLEHNPNVGNLRAATAVFRFVNGQWETDGRALFNLSPAQAIEHFQHELETAD